ncbi:MAG: Ig-like domain-containing protein [Limisphaerales bacterium]
MIFFTIDQDSSDDQLDIFQNDYSPNDDAFFVSNLIPAQHGNIAYSLDASTFQYTPDPGFYGVDSFGYSITSGYGDTSSNAIVTVFVNQTGNSPPIANDLIITLETNTYTASFNALTNSSDPDGDTNILFAISTPSLGTVSTNANGDITYTRDPNLFGGDAFTYTITDGKGGYGVCNVKILQLDTDGDGMPDQWEMANGLDPATDDSLGDPDNDGLPNLAEFILGTNPNVPDNPLNLSSVTNGQIDLGWDLTDGNGNQISFGNIQAVFYLHPPAGSGGVQPADTSPSPVFSTWFLKDIANAAVLLQLRGNGIHTVRNSIIMSLK